MYISLMLALGLFPRWVSRAPRAAVVGLAATAPQRSFINAFANAMGLQKPTSEANARKSGAEQSADRDLGFSFAVPSSRGCRLTMRGSGCIDLSNLDNYI